MSVIEICQINGVFEMKCSKKLAFLNNKRLFHDYSNVFLRMVVQF